MSFDVFFHTCNLGSRKGRGKNPFTGEWVAKFDDPGLSDDERAGIAQLLKGLKAEEPNEFGIYSLWFTDGGEADLCADGLAGDGKMDGCSVQTRSFTPDVVALLFNISRIGNMVIIAAVEGVGPLVTSEEQLRRVAARYPNAKVVQSAAALERELRCGFQSWEKYRDQIIEEE